MLLTEINKEIFLLKLREIENYISEKQIYKVSKNSNLNIFYIKNKLFINNNNIVSSILFFWIQNSHIFNIDWKIFKKI